jgi:hypothetical protein
MSNTLWPAPVQRIVLGCKIPHELDALKRKATRIQTNAINTLQLQDVLEDATTAPSQSSPVHHQIQSCYKR